jgi:hypothetical protein
MLSMFPWKILVCCTGRTFFWNFRGERYNSYPSLWERGQSCTKSWTRHCMLLVCYNNACKLHWHCVFDRMLEASNVCEIERFS